MCQATVCTYQSREVTSELFTIPYSDHTQLEPYKAAPFYIHAHPNKTGKSKGAKTLPNLVVPGSESERRTREDTQG